MKIINLNHVRDLFLDSSEPENKMYKYLIIAFLFAALETVAKSKNPLFRTTIQDLGRIKQGTEQVTVEFDIKNTTGKTVIISAVYASCGCMKIDYPKQPIKDQGKGKIKVSININKKNGYFKKSILVYTTNTKPTILRITGKII